MIPGILMVFGFVLFVLAGVPNVEPWPWRSRLICFGLALRARGWRITYLGIDTPLPGLGDAAWLLQPAIVVLNLVVDVVYVFVDPRIRYS